MHATAECSFVTTTLDDAGKAAALAEALVEARLAACVQCLPIRSVYRWEGRVEKTAELLLLAKTRTALVGELTAFLRARHPYRLPEIVAWPIAGGLPDYLAWIRDETQPCQPVG